MSEQLRKQKNLSRFWFIWNLIESIILLAGGVLAIVAGIMVDGSGNANADVENAVAYTVAGFVVLDGILRVILFLARYKKDDEQSPLVVAGFEMALGILLIMMQSKFTAEHIFTYTVVNLIAIVLMTMGALLMVYAIYVIARKFARLFMPIVEILFSAILIGVGVVIEVLYNSQGTRDQLVLIMTGAILCVVAVGMFIIALVTNAKTKKELQTAENEERGDYEVSKEPVKAEPAYIIPDEPEVVDAEEVTPASGQLKGPRAIENKKK